MLPLLPRSFSVRLTGQIQTQSQSQTQQGLLFYQTLPFVSQRIHFLDSPIVVQPPVI